MKKVLTLIKKGGNILFSPLEIEREKLLKKNFLKNFKKYVDKEKNI